MYKVICIVLTTLFFSSVAMAQWEVDEWGWIIPGSEENEYFPPSGNSILNMRELDNYPIFEGQRHAITTAPVCCDLNGDGIFELIVCNDDGWIHCFEPDGSELDGWPQNTEWRIYEPPAIGDIDNDGELEMVVMTNWRDPYGYFRSILFVYAPDGSWQWTTLLLFYSGTPALCDLNQDGYLEIVFSQQDAGLTVFSYDGHLMDGFPVAEQYTGGIPCFSDVDYDGYPEIITCRSIVDRFGNVVRVLSSDLDNIVSTNHRPCVGDIDNDNQVEILVSYHRPDPMYGEASRVYLYETDGTIVQGWPKIQYYFDSCDKKVFACDLNKDGEYEVLHGTSWTGNLYGWKIDGSDYFNPNPLEFSPEPYPIYNLSAAFVTAGNLVGENENEIIVPWKVLDPGGTYSWMVNILNSDGSEIEELRTIGENAIAPLSGFTIADFNQDRVIDLLFGEGPWYYRDEPNYQYSGYTHAFTYDFNPDRPNENEWPMFCLNLHNNSNFREPVGGTLTQDCYWYGTYKVFSDVVIPSGITLTIQAGSIIRFDDERALYIEPGGRLVVNGARLDSVYFTSSSLNPFPSIWAGVILEEEADLDMSYCMIEYPKYGVDAGLGSQSTIMNCTFENCANFGFHGYRVTGASITNSKFINCGDYGAYYYGGGSVFNYNSVSGCKYGFKYLGGGSINIGHNVITALGMGSPSYWGIYVGPRIANDAPVPVLTADSVTYFGQGGIYIEGAVGGSLNQFIRSKHNTNYGLFMKNTSASTTVYGTDDAHHNTFSYSSYGIYCDKYCYSDFRWNKIVQNPYAVFVAKNANPTFGTADINSGRNRIETSAPMTGYDMRNDNTYMVLARRCWWGIDGPQLFGHVDASSQILTMPNGYERPESPEVIATLPTQLIMGCYPNPFNANAEVRFSLPHQTDVIIAIYDISGRLVRELVNGPHAAGEHAVVWDGTNGSGKKVTSGIYLYSLTTSSNDRASGKMVMLK